MAILLAETFLRATPDARAFLAEDEIKESIKTSKNFKFDDSDPQKAHVLKIFKTRRQQTWLVATKNRLYCILDDLDNARPAVQWSMGRDHLVDDRGRLTIDVTHESYKSATGMVHIGDSHREWLYSYELFADRGIVSAIQELILSAMRG